MEMASFRKLFQEALMEGIVLFNNTLAYRAPGDKTPAAVYNTGDRVEIVRAQNRPAAGARGGELFYEIARGSETLWVHQQSIRVLEKNEAEDRGAFPLDFYRRAAKNTNEKARALGVRGVMRGMKGSALLEAWRDFQSDQADEVRCAANESFSSRVVKQGAPSDKRFNDALIEALIRVSRSGGWGEQALCGLAGVLSRSSHPDKIALQWLLAERGLGERPPGAGARDIARARVLLERGLSHPESWVRRNLLAQICDVGVSTDTVLLLSERFPSMTPEDKSAVVAADWRFEEWEAARPLKRRILGLIGDRSQPTDLRLLAFAGGYSLEEKGEAVHKVIRDPGDGMRFDLAGKHCQDKIVLEEIANHGDSAAFATALTCLDAHAGKLGGDKFHQSLVAWSTPSLEANLASIAEPSRRAPLERRLKCLVGASLCPVSLSVDPDEKNILGPQWP